MNRSVLRPITEDEIRTFWNDGVVYLGCMFDADWVERVGAAIDEAPGAYGERNFIWPVSEAIRELVFDSPVGESRRRSCAPRRSAIWATSSG